MSNDSEHELIRRAVAGDITAVHELFHAQYDRLLRYVSQHLPPALRHVVGPEDVVQAVLAEAWRTIARFEPDGDNAFFRWLATLAQQRMIDALRRAQRKKRGGDWQRVAPTDETSTDSLLALITALRVDATTPTRRVARQEAIEALRQAMADLHPDYRQALELRYVDALPVPVVAQRMGRSEGAVLMLCNRGLRKLRARLGDPDKYFDWRD